MKKIFLLIIVFVALKATSFAQNDILFSHYMFNEMTFNPAVAGNSPTLDATLLARQQWIGFDDAPSSQVLNVHSYMKGIGGLGLTIINDRLGYENSLNAKLLYAHHFQLSRTSLLSLGASVGLMSKGIDGTQLIYEDDDDEGALRHRENRMRPDFGFGIEYNTSIFTLGLSSTHIEQSLGEASLFDVPRHYYAYAKFRVEASHKLNIIPTVLFKSAEFIHQVDVGALAFYDDKFWVGGSYRTDNVYVGMLGFNITPDLKFGYSYDFGTGPLRSYNDGSHEVMLRYSVGLRTPPMMTMSPRYFN